MQKLAMAEEFGVKQTSPNIAGSGMMLGGDKVISAYDLVEQMEYLYVRVVKARELPHKDVTGTCDPYVQVRVGNYKGVTKHFENKSNPEWNLVFAFAHDQLQASHVDIIVKDKDLMLDDFIGRVSFDLVDVPRRVPPDSPLAPQWYKLDEVKGGEKLRKGEIMLAVWRGTQADEAFSDAWHSDAAAVTSEGISRIRGKVYLSPRLWYLRVNVIQCQDLVPTHKTRQLEVCVKVNIANQAIKTKVSPVKSVNPSWNEDLVFVVAEPFEEPLLVIVEDKEEVLGRCLISLNTVLKRQDNKPVPAQWLNLERHSGGGDVHKKEAKFASKIHLRVSLDGGYHVLDESTHHSSDYRPSSKLLWKPSIGLLEVGIISAMGLPPMKSKDGHETTDAYCVAKYGSKWIRTRTIIDSGSPKWNEQYTWEVFDPCTVFTLGVFDNGHHQRDMSIGKVRIRLSTLETDRVYTHSYPLIMLRPSGVKKMGEIQLAVRFSCTSYMNMLHKYTDPLLPKMHYVHPLSVIQLDVLRHHSIQIVASRLGRAEPPLKKEAVEYMLDVASHIWSVRKAKANFVRVMSIMSGVIAVARWFDQICQWQNPFTTLLIHILLVILILYPELILPTFFLYLFFIGIWNYRWKPRHPPHMDIRLSHADAVGHDELDEEFDTFPTSRSSEIVRMRYDRLRSIGGRIQSVVGDLAMQGERFQSVLSWRDPRASALFVVFCLSAALVLYVTPLQIVVLVNGFYVLRHPRLRSKTPPIPANFFKRLCARSDHML